MYSSKRESIATFTKNVTYQLPDSVQHMAMIIAGNTIHADLLLELWRNIHPHPDDALAETYHSNLKTYQKKQIMAKLKKKKLPLVIVVGMLLKGFDHPPCNKYRMR